MATWPKGVHDILIFLKLLLNVDPNQSCTNRDGSPRDLYIMTLDFVRMKSAPDFYEMP